jgi:hypothetical protein
MSSRASELRFAEVMRPNAPCEATCPYRPCRTEKTMGRVPERELVPGEERERLG